MLVVGTKGETITWEGPGNLWNGEGLTTTGQSSYSWDQFRTASYEALFKSQLWVYRAIETRAIALSRLPFKCYRRDGLNRPELDRDDPFPRLMRAPSPRMSAQHLWLWTDETRGIHGMAWWRIVRDRGGRPVQLLPVHPTRLRVVDSDTYEIAGANGERLTVMWYDLIPFLENGRAISPLEPLRKTLHAETSAQAATSANWDKGARPSLVLKHPKSLGNTAVSTLRESTQEFYGGASNSGNVMVLEEGMTADVVTLNAADAQYIESRKLNREEVAAAYGMPPPVLGILDHATYSNIKELFRSMYREVVAPQAGTFQAAIETYLRRGYNPRTGGPNFPDDIYGEFLLEDMLRGTPEEQIESLVKAVQAGLLTPAEGRRILNRREIPGSDVLFANAAMQPLERLAEPGTGGASQIAEAVRSLYLGVGTVLTSDEARRIANLAGANLPVPGGIEPPA